MTDVRRRDEGVGTLLVCLHGISSSSASFAAQFAELADTHRVVAWDAPGYGESPDPPGPMELTGYADAAAGLVKELGERAHVFGTSWGGTVALQLALDYPELCRSLILVGASRGGGREPQAADAMRGRVAALAEQGAARFAAEHARRLLSPHADDGLVEQVRTVMAGALREPGYGWAVHAMADADLTAHLAEVSVPTLILCGEEDDVTGPQESLSLANAIPDAVYVSVTGAGHLAHQERPDSVNAWTASYLQIIERLYG